MTTTTALSPSIQTLPQVTIDRPLVPVSISRDLAIVTKALHDDGATFTKVTNNRGDFVSRSPEQRVAATLRKLELTRADAFGGLTILSAISGIAIGGAVSVATGLPIFLLVAGSITALGAATVPVSATYAAIADKLGKRTKNKLIPLADVQPLLERLQSASGVERALGLTTAREWRDEMKKNHALSPEARVAFDQAIEAETQAVAAHPDVNVAVAERVALLKEIANVLDTQHGEVSGSFIALMAALVARAPAQEQHELMGTVAELLDQRPQSYDAKHALYDLKLKYGLA